MAYLSSREMLAEEKESKKTTVLSLWENHKHPVFLPVRGRSMHPLIEDRDLVALKNTPPTEINRGDVIAFVSKGGFVVHRVIRSKLNGQNIFFCQKGDSSPFYSWIKGTEILGRVVEVKGEGRLINLSRFRWKLYNRCLALLGSLWVSVSKNGKNEDGKYPGEGNLFILSRGEKGFFFLLKALSFLLVKMGSRRSS